jgi:hypothetical protein
MNYELFQNKIGTNKILVSLLNVCLIAGTLLLYTF